MMVWMDWVNLWKDWEGSASKWERLGASRVLGGSCSGEEQDEPYDGYDKIFERNLSKNGDRRIDEEKDEIENEVCTTSPTFWKWRWIV